MDEKHKMYDAILSEECKKQQKENNRSHVVTAWLLFDHVMTVEGQNLPKVSLRGVKWKEGRIKFVADLRAAIGSLIHKSTELRRQIFQSKNKQINK